MKAMIPLGKPELVEKLKQQMIVSGPLSFAEFMREALYAPALGYYTSGDRPVGRQGDFYTSVSVGKLFGRLLAGQFAEIWRQMGQPNPFHLVEQGAHHGQLAHDVLTSLREDYPEIWSSIRYVIIEPSDHLGNAQKTALADPAFSDRIEWLSSPHFAADRAWRGVFFSNELVDSFPVHVVTFQQGKWKEKGVAWNPLRTCFEWTLLPDLSVDLERLIQKWELPEIENYTTELCLEIEPWMSSVQKGFSQAVWMTIDYGWTAEEYFHPSRSEGTLLCYSQHHTSSDPLNRVGEQDITAHVNFTTMTEAGAQWGLKTLGIVDQHHAMVGLASETVMKEWSECALTPARMKEMRAFQSLSHPEIMGRSFRFLVQAQNWTPSSTLEVLKFSGKADSAASPPNK